MSPKRGLVCELLFRVLRDFWQWPASGAKHSIQIRTYVQGLVKLHTILIKNDVNAEQAQSQQLSLKKGCVISCYMLANFHCNQHLLTANIFLSSKSKCFEIILT